MGFRAEHSDDQLFFRHLKREDGHWNPFLDSRILGEIEAEGSLAHAGPSSDDDEIRALKACGPLIQIFEPRRHAGDEFLLLKELFNRLETLLDDITDGVERGLHPIFRDLKERSLCFVEKLFHIAPILITLCNDFG